MKETNIKNAKTAVTITTALTFFAAGFEVIMAFMGSKPGMNIFDIASFAMANPNVYCLILILVNIILLPSAILLYRQNGISLKKEIAEKKSTLMLFNVKDFKSLIMSSEDLKTLWIQLLEEGLRYKMYRENGFLVENATERYLHFRRLFPMLCERVPQKHIATYLGITPESLSRIRKAMKEG